MPKLKSRREHLEEYANDYYTFLAKKVDIVGSKKAELFRVTRQPDGHTIISVFRIDKDGHVESQPYYSRDFARKETKEIRLYGLAGNDRYEINGTADEAITVRIIGGTDRDSIIDRSVVRGHEPKTRVYDDRENDFITSKETKLTLSSDSAIHSFPYDGFRYNYERIKPVLFYSFEDKFYVGVAYTIKRHGWRSDPYKNRQNFQVNYSVIQKAFSFSYTSDFKEVLGKWNIGIDASYDLLRWTNFFGLGNETTSTVKTTNYYQLQSKNLAAFVNFYHSLGKHAQFSIGPVYQSWHILQDPDRFVYSYIADHKHLYERQDFAGGAASLVYSNVDNGAVPSKGFYMAGIVQHLQNLQHSNQVTRYDAQVQLFATLAKNLVLAVRPAAATVTGEPEFYQHVSIGGSNTLRGFQRDRFWGTSSFYSDQELRYLFIHGRYGLTGFYDIGRVWQKGENSSTWHAGYGGGIALAPFYKALVSLTYGMSEEGNFIHIRLYRAL